MPLLLFDAVGPFSWSTWSLHPSTLIGCGLLVALHFWVTGPVREREGQAVDRAATIWFSSAIVLMLVILNGPLHELSDHYLFAAHMVQHLLLTLVVPPLLIRGVPSWAISLACRNPTVLAAGRFLGKPLHAFLLYNAVLVLWHTAPLYELTMTDHNIHIMEHVTFLVTATIMWWPVMSRVNEVPPMTYPAQMVYLFLLGIPMQIIAAFISLSTTVIYDYYSMQPRTFGISAIEDQQIGGIIMWVLGGMYFWGAMSVVFFRWNQHETDDVDGKDTPFPTARRSR